MSARSWVAGAAVAGIALAGCSGGGAATTLPREKPTHAVTYVAIGGSETEGHGARDRLQGAWPQLVFRNDLPISTVFVNLAHDAVTDDDLFGQVDVALPLRPTVVTIESDDLVRHGVDPAAYEVALGAAVAQLEATGAKVLLATTLPVDRTVDDDFNTAIRAVAAQHGATVAPVHAAFTRAATNSSGNDLVSADGGLTPAGHARYAATIARALDQASS